MEGYSPGNAESLEGAGTLANFVQNDQATRRGMVQNVRGLRHLDQEGAASSSDVIDRSDARKNTVYQANSRLYRRHKTAHLSQQGYQGYLAQVGRFSSHIRSSQDKQLVRLAVEIEVIWHKAIEHALDHGVAPLPYHDAGTGIDTRTHVVVEHGHFRQGRQRIQLRDGGGDALQQPCLLGDAVADSDKEGILQRHTLLRGM